LIIMSKTLKHPMNITWTRSTTKKTGVIAGCLLALALAGCGTTAAAATPSASSAAPAPTVTQTVVPAPVPTRTVIVQPAPVQTVYQPAQGSSALTSCGSSGVYAGSNTSCPFALNVQQAWSASGVTNGTVYAYSPVTGQSYAMSCTEAGAGTIECSGGNNAYVQF
jgi:ABC-type Fe3+-hydroxamate transport system substrate-binding protein